MAFAKVSVELRSQVGKGGAHKVRVAGKVPGVLYGRKSEPLSVAFDERTLLASLDKERRRNTVLTLTVAGATSGEEITAMVRDAQIDPISRKLMHVDFLRVDLDQEVHVSVPLVLTGKAVGVIEGGNLHQSTLLIPVAAKPAAIPTKIEVDVSALGIGHALHASDLKLPEGVRTMLDGRAAIASVVAPKAEKVEEVVAAPVEGAVPAEGSAVAAPGAAPAAAGDKPAAAGKKEGGGEKKGK